MVTYKYVSFEVLNFIILALLLLLGLFFFSSLIPLVFLLMILQSQFLLQKTLKVKCKKKRKKLASDVFIEILSRDWSQSNSIQYFSK